MRLAFVDPIDWDYRIESPYQQPMGGSQSALCYLAEALAQQGHDLFLLNHTASPGISQGVVCLPLTNGAFPMLAALRLDTVIVLNSAKAGRQIKPWLGAETLLILWTQHAPDQSEMQGLRDPEAWSVYDAIAFVSTWQQQQTCQTFGIPLERTRVLRNGIAPCFATQFSQPSSIVAVKSSSPMLAYTSTPFRGLELLLEAFPAIRAAVPETRLKVFSSMKVYQFPEAEDPFAAIYHQCQQMEGVDYIGSLPQPELAMELQSAQVLSYPNIFLETSCIAVLEAMACGCHVITSDLAALPETTAGWATLVPVPTNNSFNQRFVSLTPAQRQAYLSRFVEATVRSLQTWETTDRTTLEKSLQAQVDYVNQNCTWPVLAQTWGQWLAQGVQTRFQEGNGGSVLPPPTTPPVSFLPSQDVSPKPTPAFDLAQFLNQAVHLGETGQFAAAAAICEEILHQDPTQARAWHLLGLATLQLGESPKAVSHLEQAIALNPFMPEFYNHLGVALCTERQWEAGIRAYRQAIALDASPDAYYNLGLALQRQGQIEEAIATYRQLVMRYPDHSKALMDLGQTLQQQQRYDQAIATYQQMVTIDPGQWEVWYQLGSLQQEVGDLQAALHSYRRSLVLHPQAAEVHNNLGTVLQEMGAGRQAIAHYQEALALRADFPNAQLNLANTCLKLERFAEAEAAYQQLLRSDPNPIQALDGLVQLRRQTCQWAGLEELSQQLMQRVRHALLSDTPTDLVLLNSLLLPFSAAEQQAIAQSHARGITRSMASLQQSLNFEARRQTARVEKGDAVRTQIRLGYVSGDFRNHATAHLIRQLFELHDRRCFEVWAYSVGPNDGSEYRQKLEQDCDRFIDIAALSVSASAERIFQDDIDILVDLGGYTTYGRPHLFALRPAPVQVSYLVYPGTLGAAFMDYIVTDPVVTPPHLEPFFTEACAYLPHSYQINDNQQAIANRPSRTSLNLPEDAFVYCCFNNTRKIEPHLFDVWMRILHQVPGSVLWLFKSNGEAEQNLRREAEKQGIGGDRLIFAPHLPKAEHLARLQWADLLLDTLCYNAHTTASDALWAGVPVITTPGETFPSRVAASLLMAIDLPEGIVENLTAYEHLAVHLAHHPPELQGLKAKLEAHRLTTPLFDTAQFVRDLETAFRQMWQRYQGGRSPHALWVAEPRS